MKVIGPFDSDLTALLNDWMLVCDKNKRKTCAECLSSPYLDRAKPHHSKTNPLNVEAEVKAPNESFPTAHARIQRDRLEDHSEEARKKGTLWKLNTGKDPADAAAWLQRDMWIANNGSLCYFSQRDEKKLVLINHHKLSKADIKPASGAAKDNAFSISCSTGDAEEGSQRLCFMFAADSPADLKKWIRILKSSAATEVCPTNHFGNSFNLHLKQFKLLVKNRRMKVEGGYEHDFEPVYKGNLWKVKTAGDLTRKVIGSCGRCGSRGMGAWYTGVSEKTVSLSTTPLPMFSGRSLRRRVQMCRVPNLMASR
jgi:hypothetical protein